MHKRPSKITHSVDSDKRTTKYSNKTVHVEEFNKTKSVNLNLPNSGPTKHCDEDVALAFVHTPARVSRLPSQNVIICIPTGSVYTILIKGFISEHQRISTMLRSLIRFPQYYCYFCLRLIYERPLLLAQRIVMSVFVRPPTLYYPFVGPARMPLFRLISL